MPWMQPSSYNDRPCLRDSQRSLTYVEASHEVEAVADQLNQLGVIAGDVVAVMLTNRTELLVVMWAAWRLGAAVTPMNPVFTTNEASYQLSDSHAVIVVADSDGETFAGVPLLPVDQLAKHANGIAKSPAVSAEDLALIVYTSGSTGRPKGVLLDHARLEFMTTTLVNHTGLGSVDGVVEHCVLALPLFHMNAICVSWLTSMVVGGQLTILARFTPDTFLAAIGEHRPTYFSSVPTMYTSLVELPAEVVPDVSSLRFSVCGAAPASRELLVATENRFGITLIEGYGLTEGTCASACNPMDGVRKVGTVGPALPGQTIAIA